MPVTHLHLDICPGTVLQYRADIEGVRLVAFYFRRESFVLKDLHGVEPVFAGSVKYRIDEAQQLDLIAYAHRSV
jgi:hypothetical protein